MGGPGGQEPGDQPLRLSSFTSQKMSFSKQMVSLLSLIRQRTLCNSWRCLAALAARQELNLLLNFSEKKSLQPLSLCLPFQSLPDLFIFVLNVVLYFCHPKFIFFLYVTYNCVSKEVENKLQASKDLLGRKEGLTKCFNSANFFLAPNSRRKLFMPPYTSKECWAS